MADSRANPESGISFVAQDFAPSWFESSDHALEMARDLELFAANPDVLNPQVVLAESRRILEIAVLLESSVI
jgi:hypothetical protein